MNRWAIMMAGLLLPGCVPPPAYGPAYRQAYAPRPYYRPELVPLPEDMDRAAPAPAPPRPRQAAAPRPRPAVPTVTASAPAAVPASAADPGAALARAAAPEPPAGPECRTVTQVGYADGREVQRQERFCRSAPGRDWVKS